MDVAQAKQAHACENVSSSMEFPEPLPCPLVLGTRGSALALFQANTTQSALEQAFPGLQVRQQIIRTTGDRRTDVALAQVAKAEGIFDKGVFIKELESALDAGEIDLAVHSLKDVPTVLDSRFELAAVLERAPTADVLVCREALTLETLPIGARIGTSSVRRARQVAHLRPDLQVTDLRGNVPTRLEKVLDGTRHDAILLAEAGLVRLGYLPEFAASATPEPVLGIPGLFAFRLPQEQFFPAAGQGAIALEIRAGDATSAKFAQALNHPETWLRITSEREFLRLLNAGCHTPVGVFSRLDKGILEMHARVFNDCNPADTAQPAPATHPREGTASGTDPIQVALNLFRSLS